MDSLLFYYKYQSSETATCSIPILGNSESGQKGISDCECCYSCPCFGKAGKNQSSASPQKALKGSVDP